MKYFIDQIYQVHDLAVPDTVLSSFAMARDSENTDDNWHINFLAFWYWRNDIPGMFEWSDSLPGYPGPTVSAQQQCPGCHWRFPSANIIRRIPKGAWIATADALAELINDAGHVYFVVL